MKSEEGKAFGVQTATIIVPVRARNSLLYSHFCLRHEPETTRSHLAVLFTLSLKFEMKIAAFANYLRSDTGTNHCENKRISSAIDSYQ